MKEADWVRHLRQFLATASRCAWSRGQTLSNRLDEDRRDNTRAGCAALIISSGLDALMHGDLDVDTVGQ
jgi:hypothetical protein